ncbi:MAG: hypothetical protein FWD15_01720 [Alphaproteobacteria bacterium]|nr:hypothetical protein [Alphaproteobacteria bacterium]
MQPSAIAKKLLDFAHAAGEYALKQQGKIDFSCSAYKSASVVDTITKIDLELTRRFHKFARENFAKIDYFIIDEETTETRSADPVARMMEHEYTFVLDPLDGTLPYSAGLPNWVVSIGVFKGIKPVAGVAFAPALDFLVYADDKKAYSIERGRKTEIKKGRCATPPILLTNFQPSAVPNKNYDSDKMFALNFYSAILSLMYVATGKVAAYRFKAYFWDMAGALTALHHAGVEMRGLKSGKLFDPRSDLLPTLRIKENFIASLPEDYKYIKSVVG